MSRVLRNILTGVAGIAGVVLGAVVALALVLLVLPLPSSGVAAPVQPWDIAVTLTEDLLARQVGAGGTNQPLPLTDAHVGFQADGTVKITGMANPSSAGGGAGGNLPSLPLPRPSAGRGPTGGNAGIPVVIVLRPTVAAGQLKTDLVSVQLGSLAVPSRLANLLDGPLANQLDRSLNGQGYRLVEVTVQ